MVKNLPANAGDTEDAGSISGSGRSPGVANGNPLQYSTLTWRIPQTEKPDGLQSKGHKELDRTEATKHSTIFNESMYILKI